MKLSTLLDLFEAFDVLLASIVSHSNASSAEIGPLPPLYSRDSRWLGDWQGDIVIKSKETYVSGLPTQWTLHHHTLTASQSWDSASGQPQKGFGDSSASFYSPNKIFQFRLHSLLQRLSQHPQLVSSLPFFSPILPQHSPKRSFSEGVQTPSCSSTVLHFQENQSCPSSSTCMNGPLWVAPSQPPSVPSYHILHHTSNEPPTTQQLAKKQTMHPRVCLSYTFCLHPEHFSLVLVKGFSFVTTTCGNKWLPPPSLTLFQTDRSPLWAPNMLYKTLL